MNSASEDKLGVPLRSVLLENGKMVLLYGLGTSLMASVWWPLGLVYLVYCVVSIFLFIAWVCPYCYCYNTRTCPNAYHLVSGRLFRPKKGRRFADQFRRNHAVMYPGWFLPPVAGLYSLIVADFSWLVLVRLVLFCLFVFVLFPYISRRYVCATCKNAENCPRHQGRPVVAGSDWIGEIKDMGARVWRGIAPPVFEDDEEKTRIARLLHIILLIVFVLVAVYTVISLFTDIYVAGLAVEAALLLIPAGLLFLSRRGKVQLAGFILSLLLWALISVGTYAYGGLQGSGPSSFFGVALIAGLLLGGRAAILFALLSVLSLGGILLAEMLGVAPSAPEFITPTYRWMELSTTIIGVGGLFYLVTRSLESALGRARQNEREAIEASNFKSRLIARVSHELRTPLGAVLGLAEMLDSAVYGPLSPEQSELTQKIVRNSYRLNHMVSELLDQSHFESTRLRLRLAEFSPRETVARVVSTLEPLAESKGLTLRLDIAGDLSNPMLGDSDRIGQILYNLIDNAVKFTHVGAIDVRVYQPDGEHWALQVADTGIGVPEEAREYIFDPFRQVDESVTREYGGVGLGLTITKQLVTLMKGEIILESQVGRGSTFTVVLPLSLAGEG